MLVTAAILAGGRARRLGGVAKGLVTVAGTAIVARQLAALAPLVGDRVIVAGDPAPYAAIAAQHGARLVRDRDPGRGPLAGLDAAVAESACDWLLAFACDLPFLDEPLVRALLAPPPGADAVVPRVDGRAQPLAAGYARAIAPRVRARLDAGQLRLLELVDELTVHWLELPAGARALVNVNTPEDLARAEELARPR
jgi:molybdopterin-guanine dinucleotide biosynthesis protein A